MSVLVKIAKGQFVNPSEVAGVSEIPLIDSATGKESVGYVMILFKSGKMTRLANTTAEEIVGKF